MSVDLEELEKVLKQRKKFDYGTQPIEFLWGYDRTLIEAVPKLIALVRELERQREFFLKALNDNRLCPNGGCFHDGSDLDEWDCTSYDNRECWIQAAKEAGE